jgi:hypothetical protein
LGAAAPVLAQAIKPPAVELNEIFQRYNEPATTQPSASETDESPFLGSLLTALAAACKQ